MNDKEQIYDEQIAPLIVKIVEICKVEQIPMFAEFQYGDLNFCTTCIYPDVDGRNITTKLYDVLSKCRIEEGVNIDQFFFHIAKNYPNKSSIIMNMLGKKPVSWQLGSNGV